MLTKPDLPDQTILALLQDEYGLPQVEQIAFLPLGADVNTAVYRVSSANDSAYFLKLRKGSFDELSVTLPHFLRERGISAIIPPLESRTGRQSANLDAYTTVLYPFIVGRDGYEVALTDSQWTKFGAALKKIHTVQLPPAFVNVLPREDYSSHWREKVKAFQAQAVINRFEEPVAAKMAAFVNAHRSEVDRLVQRADRLGRSLRAQPRELVLCHSDIHPGNLLICENGQFFIVDWDNPSLSPKERDLNLIGGSPSSGWDTQHSASLFYRGYSPADIDPTALAYYRCERIIEDIAAYCEQLLSGTAGSEDREKSYQYFSGQFLAGHEIELAFKTGSPEMRSTD